MLLKGILVFCAAFAVDFAYTGWIYQATAKHAWRAGLLSAWIGFLGYVSLWFALRDYRLLVPDLAGLFLGSYFGVKRTSS